MCPLLGTWPATQALCPTLGIKLMTLWFAGLHLIYWATPASGFFLTFLFSIHSHSVPGFSHLKVICTLLISVPQLHCDHRYFFYLCVISKWETKTQNEVSLSILSTSWRIKLCFRIVIDCQWELLCSKLLKLHKSLCWFGGALKQTNPNTQGQSCMELGTVRKIQSLMYLANVCWVSTICQALC